MNKHGRSIDAVELFSIMCTRIKEGAELNELIATYGIHATNNLLDDVRRGVDYSALTFDSATDKLCSRVDEILFKGAKDRLADNG